MRNQTKSSHYVSASCCGKTYIAFGDYPPIYLTSSEASYRPHRRSLCYGKQRHQAPSGHTSANSSRTAANLARYRCCSRRDVSPQTATHAGICEPVAAFAGVPGEPKKQELRRTGRRASRKHVKQTR